MKEQKRLELELRYLEKRLNKSSELLIDAYDKYCKAVEEQMSRGLDKEKVFEHPTVIHWKSRLDNWKINVGIDTKEIEAIKNKIKEL